MQDEVRRYNKMIFFVRLVYQIGSGGEAKIKLLFQMSVALKTEFHNFLK